MSTLERRAHALIERVLRQTKAERTGHLVDVLRAGLAGEPITTQLRQAYWLEDDRSKSLQFWTRRDLERFVISDLREAAGRAHGLDVLDDTIRRCIAALAARGPENLGELFGGAK